MSIDRKALVIGIDHYGPQIGDLAGCVNDATAMASRLARHHDNLANYDVRLLTSTASGSRARTGSLDRPERRKKVTSEVLLEELSTFFSPAFEGEALFYFAGHGEPTFYDGRLLTQPGHGADRGVPMSEILLRAECSGARDVKLIIDCCYAGRVGVAAVGQRAQMPLLDLAQLRKGITIMAAAGVNETAAEESGHGMFTGALISGLDGLAADVRGCVTAASLFGFARSIFSAHDQQPIFKSHVDSLVPVRRCRPRIDDEALLELPTLFPADHQGRPKPHTLNPTYEYTLTKEEAPKVKDLYADMERKGVVATAEGTRIFRRLKQLRDAGLLSIEDKEDLFWATMKSKCVMLTDLGVYYWRLARDGKFRRL